MRDTHGDPAGCGDGIEIAITLVVAHECDLRFVGAELGVLLLASGADDGASLAAVLVHDPDVVGVDEKDVILPDIGIPEHPGVLVLILCEQGRRGHRDPRRADQQRGLLHVVFPESCVFSQMPTVGTDLYRIRRVEFRPSLSLIRII